MVFQLEFWHWYALALILVVVESMVPSGVFAAMALGAGIVGSIFLTYPELGWQPQLAIFAGITMVLGFIFTSIVAKRKAAHADDELPMSTTMIGQEFVLTSPLQNSFGEIELDGNYWSLKGPDMKPGELVRVVGVDGHMLAIMPVSVLSATKDPSENELK